MGSRRHAGRAVRPWGATPVLAIVGVTILVTLLIAPSAPTPSHTSSSRSAPSSAPIPASLGPLHHGLRAHGLVGAGPYYLQEGATISQIDGNGITAGLSRLSEQVVLVTSPYSTAYELNGLTNVGDWFQIVIGDNWPGCNSGFEEAIEVWNNVQGSGPVTCDSTVTLSAGDTIDLNLTFSGTNVCLQLYDVSTHSGHGVCQAPPDSGGSYFSFLSTASDGNGYYTGPMTEVVDTTASSCLTYNKMPTVSYRFFAGTWITGWVPWSDERDISGGSSGVCYQSGNGVSTLSNGNPTSQYVDLASGATEGPHWSAAQNYSYLDARFSFRFETDTVPMTAVTLSASATLLSVGGYSILTLNVTGGKTPASGLWLLNGSIVGLHPAVWNWTATATGVFVFSVDAVDAVNDVFGPSNSVTVNVPGVFSVLPLSASPASGHVDVGQSVTFSSVVSGGLLPYSFSWTGLPPGCASADVARLTCSPSAAGTVSVVLAAHDSNGSSRATPPMAFTTLSGVTASLTATPAIVDVGGTIHFVATVGGGSGTFGIQWLGLPIGCASRNLSQVACVPSGLGGFATIVAATDTNGELVRSSVVTTRVNSAPSVTIAGSRSFLDAGQSVTLTPTVQGGTPPYRFAWSGLPAGCSLPNVSVQVCVPVGSGGYTTSVLVTDATNATATSSSVYLTVFPALSVSVAGPTSATAYTPVSWTADASGGASGNQYVWNGLPSDCASANGSASFTCGIGTPGTYTITVTVTDAAGATATYSHVLTITPIPPSASPWALVGGPLGVGVLVIVAITLLAVGAFAARRRGRTKPPGPEEL